MKLIVGLGNPGLEYVNTRHNAGFMIIDNYAKTNNFSINKNKFNGLYVDMMINGEKVIFLKPQSFMNLSGEVIKKFVDFYKIPKESIFIIHDDLDIPLGKYKLKPSGSSGGHNGLKNIEQCLDYSDYKRLKIGISKQNNIEAKDYVLGKFRDNEVSDVTEFIKIGTNIIADFLVMDFDKLMSKYNHK